MIQMRTILDVADNSGARKLSMILPLGGSTGRYAGLGDVITANVKESAPDAPDPVKKGKAQLDLAQMLLDSGAADKALAEYQAILTSTPDSPEANLGAGLSLYAAGDKAKFQQAANYLQKFVEVAPDTHQFKDDAKAILTEMKNSENITPEKKPPAKRRP